MDYYTPYCHINRGGIGLYLLDAVGKFIANPMRSKSMIECFDDKALEITRSEHVGQGIHLRMI